MPMQVTGVAELAQTLGTLPAEIKTAMRPALVDAGDIVGEQVKANASFSSWIPGAVTVSASFSGTSGGAKIKVAERGFPHAGEVGVYEGNGVSSTLFRHPVFNHGGWATGVTHPFAHPALEQKRDEATEVIATAVQAVIASSGL